MKNPKVSIIIPVKAINDYIREAVPRHLALNYPDFEVLILPDLPEADSNPPLADGPSVRVIPTHPQTGPADKRDIGAREARGEVLAFIDDDAYPSKNWLASAVGYFEDPTIAAVCGPGMTPPGDSVGQKVSGWVQASRLGGGNYTYRFLPQKKRLVDDYPSMNFVVRKSDFEKVGGFDSHFYPGEDTKFCHELVYGLNKKIIYDPDVLVYHHRRDLWRPHLKQLGGYGLHRGHFARILPKTSRRLSYFIPTLFTLFVFGAPFLFFFSVNNLTIGQFDNSSRNQVLGLTVGPNTLPLTLSALTLATSSLLFAFYFLLLLSTAAWVYSKERNFKVALLTIPGIFATHICYGLRFIQGFFSKNLRR